MTLGVGTILTGGLGQDATALIVGPFRLFISAVIVAIPPPPTVGGSFPLAPGEIQNLYKIVDSEEMMIPYELLRKKEQFIFVTVTMNDEVFKKSIRIEAPENQVTLKSVKISETVPRGVVDANIIHPFVNTQLQPTIVKAAKTSPVKVSGIKVDNSTDHDK